MRMRMWIFTVLVAGALAINLGLVSLRVAQSAEDTVRTRLSVAQNALKSRLQLLDARSSARAAAVMPELIEATRAPADPTVPLARPDEKALRAAAAAIVPEPDLLAVENPQGAVVSRRSRPVQTLDDASSLPFGRAALEGAPQSTFATLDGALYRVSAARVPGTSAAVVAGVLIDDRFAAQLRTQLDAEVALLQGGKVVASSLPAPAREEVARWVQAPAPGFGTLRVSLPVVGSALSGKLPRGSSRYATRGALVQLEGGVQAAVLVQAAPYLGWLARYQAFYLLCMALLLLLGFVWGLAGGRAKAEEAAPRGAPAPDPTLDVGEARAPRKPTRDVPWSPGEGPSGEHPVVTPRPPPVPIELEPEAPAAPAEEADLEAAVRAAEPEAAVRAPEPEASVRAPEPLDPVLPAAALQEPEVKVQPVRHDEPQPVWGDDPFVPPPAQSNGVPVSAAAQEAMDWPAPRTEPVAPAAAAVVQPHGEFSFAGLLDEVHGAHAPETTAPGAPTPALIEQSRGGLEAPTPGDVFPGDEPTRIEPVSAALLDKLREKDEELAAAAAAPQASGEEAPRAAPESEAPAAPESEAPAAQTDAAPEATPAPEGPAPDANVTLSDFSMPAAAVADPDEAHWRETWENFRALKAKLGEPADRISFDKFSAKLRKNRDDLMARHNARGVRFSVYEKDGKAAIKASAVR